MSDNSRIEWTQATWNPIIGCTKVSPGCDNCYPIPLARIRERNPNRKVADAFAGVVERTEDGLDWTGRVNLLPERLEQPLKWRRGRRIFVNSLSDLFHPAVPDEYIARVWEVMAATPQHTYQILTKRHARMRAWFRRWPSAVLSNVWLGVSAENQKWADIRIPALLRTPAAVRFVSAEPLLGPVDITQIRDWCPTHDKGTDFCVGPCPDRRGLDWVIVGGESGQGARPMHPDWARSLRDQCASAGIPFFFKQWGEWSPTGMLGIGRPAPGRIYVGEPVDEHGHRVEMARVGKGRAGRELDGRTWDEFPRTPEPAEVAS